MNQWILWCDLETDGLEAWTNNIWEVAAIITDLNFNEVSRYHCYIKHNTMGGLFPLDKYLEEFKKFNNYVWEMHTKTGLMESWMAAQEDGTAIKCETAAEQLLEFIADKDHMMVLGGSSVHYDHNFIISHMPKFAARLLHRHLDTSSLKMFINTFGKPNFSDKFRDDQGTQHLAMDDISNDIRWAKNFKEFLLPLIKEG